MLITIMSILLLVIGGMGILGMSKDSEVCVSFIIITCCPRTRFSRFRSYCWPTSCVLRLSVQTTPELIQKNLAEVGQNMTVISRIWDAYVEAHWARMKKIWRTRSQADRERFVMEGLQPAISALRNNDTALANKIMRIRSLPFTNQSVKGFRSYCNYRLTIPDRN